MTAYHLGLLIAGWRRTRNSARFYLEKDRDLFSRAAARSVLAISDARIELALRYLHRLGPP